MIKTIIVTRHGDEIVMLMLMVMVMKTAIMGVVMTMVMANTQYQNDQHRVTQQGRRREKMHLHQQYTQSHQLGVGGTCH